jgi:hypothetical protein
MRSLHRQTTGSAVVLAIGVVIVMFLLSAELPALGNPVLLAMGALVALSLDVRVLGRK